MWLLDILWTALGIFIETINRPQHCYESAYEVGLPSYTGGCQYSFDQQVDRQNIVLKIDSDDYPMKSDLHGLKCAIINNNGHRDLLCSDPRPLPRPSPGPDEHECIVGSLNHDAGQAGADRVQNGACAGQRTPTLPLYDSVHICTPFVWEIEEAGSKTSRPRQLPCVRAK